ncbi:MAG: hypothetical protein ACYCOU_06685, partial [Sulfobacillus sp.]
TTTSTTPEPAGVIQLRPVIPPKGVPLPTCPPGEDLGTCTGQLNFSSWLHPATRCPRSNPTTNPPPDTPVKIIDHLSHVPSCVFLAPASFTVTTATSMITSGIGPLQGKPGIEIVLPGDQVASYEAAMGASFRKPIAIVADGKIVYAITVEPNAAEYLPIGGALIVYATKGEIQRIVGALEGHNSRVL